MPYNAGGVLPDEDYLNMTAWLLKRADLLTPNTTLSLRNMKTILRIPPAEGASSTAPGP